MNIPSFAMTSGGISTWRVILVTTPAETQRRDQRHIDVAG
jgi:hypothetical protein